MSGTPWLTREVWTAAWKRAYRYALKLRHPPAEAEDLVATAMAAALDPAKHPWKIGERDFASHVCNLVCSAHGNHVQSYEVLHASVPLTEETLEGQVESRTPEVALQRSRKDRLVAARDEALFARVEKDALVSLLLEDGGGDTSTERATKAGHSLDEIEAARKRLKRHIQAVVQAIPAPEGADDEEDEP